MFCFQCEQTDRTGATPGCAGPIGNCGKDSPTSDLQDLPDLLAAALPGLGGGTPDLYVCGPPPLVDAVLRAAARGGVPPEQVHRERFLAT
ncbi:hypothetical protein ACIQOW_19140 [Kitasatospora sp. NPDC091335]|uniref:hypothetical protein n=1 Tax=Kitasatospora sp. NPDC091335 TaxID=3364085 RepID=UPI00380D7A23